MEKKSMEKRSAFFWVTALAIFFLFILSGYVSYSILMALANSLIGHINSRGILIAVVLFFLIAIILASGGKRHRLKNNFYMYNKE